MRSVLRARCSAARSHRLGDVDCPFCAAEDVLLGIDDLSDELAGTRARPMVGDGDREDAMRERGGGGRGACFSKRSVRAGEGNEEQYERERKEKFQ
jgi:hypothetical protein